MEFRVSEAELLEMNNDLSFMVTTGKSENGFIESVVTLWSGSKNVTQRLGFEESSIVLKGFGHLALLLYLTKHEYPIRLDKNSELKETCELLVPILDKFIRDIQDRQGIKWIWEGLLLEDAHKLLTSAFEEALDLLNSGLDTKETATTVAESLTRNILLSPPFASDWKQVDEDIRYDHYEQTVKMIEHQLCSEFLQLANGLEFVMTTTEDEEYQDIYCSTVTLWDGGRNVTGNLKEGVTSIEVENFGHLAQLLYLAKRTDGEQELPKCEETAKTILNGFLNDLHSRSGIKWTWARLGLVGRHEMLTEAFEAILRVLEFKLDEEELSVAIHEELTRCILNSPPLSGKWNEVSDELKKDHLNQITDMVKGQLAICNER